MQWTVRSMPAQKANNVSIWSANPMPVAMSVVPAPSRFSSTLMAVSLVVRS